MILIIIPLKNEARTIQSTALNLYSWCKKNIQDFEILFINDGSKDNTQELVNSLDLPNIKIINNKFDRGKGSALKAGYIYAGFIYDWLENDVIVFMDGDGQIEPIEIKTFLNLMTLYNADVVIGNKRHSYSIINYNLVRSIVSKTYNFLIRILFGFDYRDTQCGIKIFKRSALEQVIEKVTNKKYAFDLELIVALREMKLRVADAPVKVNTQKNAGSVSFISIITTLIDTISIWQRMRKGQYA